ncbi:hypothetical protein YC2023_076485 [Brassica napus]
MSLILGPYQPLVVKLIRVVHAWPEFVSVWLPLSLHLLMAGAFPSDAYFTGQIPYFSQRYPVFKPRNFVSCMEHYLQYSALSVLGQFQQEVCLVVRLLVLTVPKPASLQYATFQNLEDWILKVKILAVVCSVDIWLNFSRLDSRGLRLLQNNYPCVLVESFIILVRPSGFSFRDTPINCNSMASPFITCSNFLQIWAWPIISLVDMIALYISQAAIVQLNGFIRNTLLNSSFTKRVPSSQWERSLSSYSLVGDKTSSPPPLYMRDRLIPIAISEKLFNSFTVLLSCVSVCTRPEDATRLVLVMCSGGKGWFSTSQHIQHMVTMVYESGFTMTLLPTHLSIMCPILLDDGLRGLQEHKPR